MIDLRLSIGSAGLLLSLALMAAASLITPF
jgi:hypothetical protein